MHDDRRLVRQLKQGDREGLRRIYERYKDDLLTVAASLLHDSCAAEDVLHDVFVSFAAGVGRLELRGSLKSYLMASILNRVRDSFRRNACRTIQLEKAEIVGSRSDGPEQAALFGEESRLLADALSRLPSEQREVVVLHLNGGLNFRQIGDLQGVSPSTAQGRYRYGLDKLRTILNGELKT